MAPLSKEIKALAEQPWFPVMMRELGYEKVVRCKDCEHWDTSWRPNDPTTHFCVEQGEFNTADFYCGDGIRRQTESE